jgi:hypothetical protein
MSEKGVKIIHGNDTTYSNHVTVLSDWDRISSALMWGLPEVEDYEFNCDHKTFREPALAWFEGNMATGRVTHVEVYKNAKFQPIANFGNKDLYKRECDPHSDIGG